MTVKNVREEALRILERVEKEGAYSNLLLNHVLNEGRIAEKDSNLLTELVYGTIKRKNTLDYYLGHFINKGISTLDSWVLQLLRLSLYQLIYLDRIPDRAVVHEAVNIAKKRGHKGVSSLVNGVLRSVQRQGVPNIDSSLSTLEKLSIETSHPVWLLEEWRETYGTEQAEKMAYKNLETPYVTIRVNRLQTKKETVKYKLENHHDCQLDDGKLAPEALRVISGHVIGSEVYKTGDITVQDESSMLPSRLLDPKPGMLVLDACAAPGGKTTHMAEMMDNEGDIHAFDIHRKKVGLIDEQASRLGISIIKADALDARKLTSRFETLRFDRILVDAPCSGYGVIRRKPELKWQKQKEDLERFPGIQLSILEEASELLKEGGRLVYSTCTVRKEENEEVVEMFLKNNRDFVRDSSASENFPSPLQEFDKEKDGQVTILPHYFDTDGFFMAALKKKNKGNNF
ncbi:16S rRNA (cytosine(967)-C(5))-methyltransferase RsmB [Alteribacillus iranensis]|uniref:16S rRNA (cytosine(967)-C(5))-methyltransferase n=1 Tax=Alteribacillus iranensis TaxID=930128 RepID=A0A1I2A824_9BACI|nr:16S rRNA (cytosine(967)-C(5))-methyltransferase RsmB [Alteribacillus iranensis]SFE40101.1 16S rRNA (cytosine967-C5)-methyltransferase [Alteribacillus iranensis]